MKWDSTYGHHQRRLEEAYDRLHNPPTPPPDFTAPTEQPRQIIPVSAGIDIYLRTDVSKRENHRLHFNSDAAGEIRVTGRSEHISIDLPADAIPELIAELEKLQEDLHAYNTAAADHRAAKKAYETAYDAYKREREKTLREGVNRNHTKITGDMMTDEPDKVLKIILEKN
jgi:hypothetical protein